MTVRHRAVVKKQLRAIKRAIVGIERSFEGVSKMLRRAERAAARKTTGRAGRKLRITPKRRAQLKLQGAYMGYMRQLSARQKSRVKSLKEKRGYEAAIRLAKRIAGAA